MQGVRTLLVAAHLVAFAIALSAVLRADWRLLTSDRVDADALRTTRRTVTLTLVALAITGGALIGIDTRFDPAEIAARPKLLAKLTVIAVLVGNGALLHAYAFPALAGTSGGPHAGAAAVSVLGAVSTTSWLYATVMGVASPLAPSLGYAGFMTIYGALLAAGGAVALALVRPRLAAMLSSPAAPAPATRAAARGSPPATWR